MNGGPSWLERGTQFAGYLVQEFLGAGGMAAVYRAYHDGMGREVALKVLAESLAGDEAFRQRFLREARAVAKVEHPHIIPVYEAGQVRGVPYIAMRLVRGGDLRQMVDRDGPMPARRAAAFLSPVASALDTAHEVGLVHRDVKPANMLVDVGRLRPEHVYLSDFGLARRVDQQGQDVTSLTTTGLTTPGQFMGTPEYASPEQITGQEVDGRADQYALGCVAYTLLTGSAPFSRGEAVAVMYAQLYDPPPLVTAVRRDLPGAVNKVLGRAMEKQPEDRYESCSAFADALREALGLLAWGSEGTVALPRTPVNGGGDPGVGPESPPGRPQTVLAASDRQADARGRVQVAARVQGGRSAASANLDRLGGGGSRVLRPGLGGGRLGGGHGQLPGELPGAAVPAFRHGAASLAGAARPGISTRRSTSPRRPAARPRTPGCRASTRACWPARTAHGRSSTCAPPMALR